MTDGGTSEEPTEAAAPAEPSAPKTPWTGDQKLAVAAGALGALGLFLPWGRVLFVEISGTEAGDGQLYALLMAGAGVAVWRRLFKHDERRWVGIVLGVLALAAAALVARLIGELQGTDIAAPGGGAFLSFFGAMGLVWIGHRAVLGPKLRWPGVVVLVVVVVGAWIGGSASAEDADFGSGFDSFEDEEAADPIAARTDEMVSVEGADVTVTSIRGLRGGSFGGDRGLLVEVEVTNTGESEEYFDSSDWSVQLPSGAIESGTFSTREDALDVFLAPGGSASGVIELPRGDGGVHVIRYTPLFEPLIEWRVEIDD